jgi:hypothetical protein
MQCTTTGNITGGNIIGIIAAGSNAITTTGNANIGNLGTTTLIATECNITSINSGLIQNGNSKYGLTANGNVSTFRTCNTTAQLVVTSTGANIAGTANILGNANVGNLGATQVLASANITILQFISNIATGMYP